MTLLLFEILQSLFQFDLSLQQINIFYDKPIEVEFVTQMMNLEKYLKSGKMIYLFYLNPQQYLKVLRSNIYPFDFLIQIFQKSEKYQ
jgi:hypothetical protein